MNTYTSKGSKAGSRNQPGISKKILIILRDSLKKISKKNSKSSKDGEYRPKTPEKK